MSPESALLRRAADYLGTWQIDDAAWIAADGPQIRFPLAAWLRAAADDAEQIGPDHRAVALARALLGEETPR